MMAGESLLPVNRSPWKQHTICACGCGEAFTEEPRVGAPKRYVDARHAKRVSMRTYRNRVKAGARIWEDRQCRRYVPKSLEDAETAFRIHCEYGKVGILHCTKALPKTSLRCPAVFHKDYECQQKLCIAYGTLLDDLMDWKMQGRYQRRFTNMDGFWLTDMEKADALNPLPTKTDNPWEDPDIYTS